MLREARGLSIGEKEENVGLEEEAGVAHVRGLLGKAQLVN